MPTTKSIFDGIGAEEEELARECQQRNFKDCD
jgi:hypothetical protein